MSALRVAIVGCGRMGTQRARAARMAGCSVVQLVDASEAQALGLAREFPAASVASSEEGPALDHVDAVFVCTPPSERGPVEMAAAANGIPFLAEKPVGLSARHAAPVVDALRATPTLNAVGYMNRHRPGVIALREVVAAHEAYAVQCHWVGTPYRKPWWVDVQGSGSPFNEQATHLIDLCRFVVGEIQEVASIYHPSRRNAIADTVAVVLRFENGACGTLLYSYRASEKFVLLNIFTTAGCRTLEGWDFLPQGDVRASQPEQHEVTPIFLAETRAFVDAVAMGDSSRIRCTFEDAYRTQLVVDAVQRSGKSGTRETVIDIDESLRLAGLRVREETR